MQLMTRDQFVEYAEQVLFGETAECLHEAIAEHNGEVAHFGDAGPGSGFRLRQAIAEYHQIARQYERLTGTKVRDPGFRLRLPA